jgi:hypothetical protein
VTPAGGRHARFVVAGWTGGQAGRAVRIAGVLLFAVVAPAGAAETEEALLARLKDSAPAARYWVAQDLGKLRSARGLDALLAANDRQAVLGYEQGLSLERDVLPDDIEQVIVRHCEDPDLGVTLAHLVVAKYRTRALFDCFARRLRQPDAVGPSQLVYAAAHTDLAVEAEMLAVHPTA